MKTYFIAFIFLFHLTISFSQCTNGILMTNCGGCESGCNLSAFGAPTCASLGNPTGNCGSVQNLSTDITVPAGCSFTVTATITSRPGCNNGSGADNGDQVKVDVPGGPKPFINGASNGTVTDALTLVGPGTIRVSARANRRDEITTYSITSIGAGGALCPSCVSSLPVELVAFDATVEERSVNLKWITNVEINNDYFTLEKSMDGVNFEEFYKVNGIGNSVSKSIYDLLDSNPYRDISYYRLKQTDLNGDTEVLGIRAVNLNSHSSFSVFPNPANNELFVLDDDLEQSTIQLVNNLGQVVLTYHSTSKTILTLDVSDLPKGNYLLKLVNSTASKTAKIILN